jgi:hypothetical protein
MDCDGRGEVGDSLLLEDAPHRALNVGAGCTHGRAVQDACRRIELQPGRRCSRQFEGSAVDSVNLVGHRRPGVNVDRGNRQYQRHAGGNQDGGFFIKSAIVTNNTECFVKRDETK